ncbi:hypothetical protein BO70DRAFT_83072 [Aspergillus heteromorphus CBS 117.55]|uniref:Uncharacterized protein n=1 Tax=Aspergillus heteromorphus CBS 117.55 TaxID=1448321 RepID=A0A317X204_9EURO|nr:uncharacterized protein BO70DRAFT_83072 [Aspergillus heteromorphus CBS 117.55]PWY91018.1 hypothetical protein BO70DRAFT_83072 [Aspergillus heteromorphus CBS 117.55]
MARHEEKMDAPDGSALTWIFDHCLRYPGTYEIPLRTMYELNCNPTRTPVTGTRAPETAFHRPSNSSTSQDSVDAAADFRFQLTHQIARLPSQPCSLPSSFVTSFLRRCFTPELEEVDFPQALTALDYLKDLENRRRKEVAAALQRLGVEPKDVQGNTELAEKYPGVLAWLGNINAQARRVEALYTQVYVGLRRWTLINEMLMEPFNKATCSAMLNTLFPPITDATVPPTSHLTVEILRSQRDGFFRYIIAVEANGPDVLAKVIAQGARDGEENGWPVVREALDKYLRSANDIIDECMTVTGPLSSEGLESQSRGHKGRKVDSGISFGSSENILGGDGNKSCEDVAEKPLPPPPSKGHKSGSTLERLARELRKLGESGKTKNLKKMKSTSALGARSGNLHSRSEEESIFEIDEQKRRRLLWEASNRKKTHAKQSSTDSR